MKKRIRLLAGAVLLTHLVGVTHSAESMLVLTEEEFEANQTFRERGVDILRKATDPLAPEIVVDRPDVGADVAPPVDIVVRFRAADDAQIDLQTLKVKYGWFDITERVMETMEVSPEGINGKIQSMRRGKYSLKLTIKDTQERKSDAKIVFEVIKTAAAGG